MCGECGCWGDDGRINILALFLVPEEVVGSGLEGFCKR